jgi:hypothetical protein
MVLGVKAVDGDPGPEFAHHEDEVVRHTKDRWFAVPLLPPR